MPSRWKTLTESHQKASPADAAEVPRGLPRLTAAVPGARILLAEDDEVNQLVTAEILTRCGFHCDTVANGREVLTALGQHDYALVLMDCQMPEIDGFETARAIRQQEQPRGVPAGQPSRLPIVALTAHAEDDCQSCLAAGMDRHLTKPVDPAHLIATINELLDTSLAPAPPNAAPPAPAPRPSSDAAGDASPFQRDALLEHCLGDTHFCCEILRTFADRAERQRAELDEAVAAGDLEALVQRAHAIKGVAANLAAEPLRERACQLEQLGRAGDAPQIAPAVAQLRRELDRCLADLPRLLAELNSR